MVPTTTAPIMALMATTMDANNGSDNKFCQWLLYNDDNDGANNNSSGNGLATMAPKIIATTMGLKTIAPIMAWTTIALL